MRITIDLKIFLFAIIFIITKQIEFYAILMAYAIIHELGHLLCGVFLRLKPETFSITPFGLQISFKPEISLYNSKVKNGTRICVKKMLLAFAGPLTNFIIATIMIAIAQINIDLQYTYIFSLIVYSNLLIAMFNLIPIYPMDGGRVVKEILSIILGKTKAYKITYMISKTVLILLTAAASIAILYIHNIAILIIIAYLWYLEIAEIRKYNRRKNIEKLLRSLENKESLV